jgi:hypothetical protein
MSNGKAYEGSCFCGEVQFTVSGTRSEWEIAIVSRADAGRQGPSTPSFYGNPKRCRLPEEQRTSARTTRRRTVFANGAKRVKATSSLSIPAWG